MQREGKFRFYENNVKTVAQRAATYIQYRYTLGHTFALSEYVCSKLGIEFAYRLDYTYKKYSMCKTFMIGAMKPVSLLFDQPTYCMSVRPQGTVQFNIMPYPHTNC